MLDAPPPEAVKAVTRILGAVTEDARLGSADLLPLVYADLRRQLEGPGWPCFEG